MNARQFPFGGHHVSRLPVAGNDLAPDRLLNPSVGRFIRVARHRTQGLTSGSPRNLLYSSILRCVIPVTESVYLGHSAGHAAESCQSAIERTSGEGQKNSEFRSRVSAVRDGLDLIEGKELSENRARNPQLPEVQLGSMMSGSGKLFHRPGGYRGLTCCTELHYSIEHVL